jgi:hypothetical protein
VSDCDREASIMRRPWPTRGCRATGKKLGLANFNIVINLCDFYRPLHDNECLNSILKYVTIDTSNIFNIILH